MVGRKTALWDRRTRCSLLSGWKPLCLSDVLELVVRYVDWGYNRGGV